MGELSVNIRVLSGMEKNEKPILIDISTLYELGIDHEHLRRALASDEGISELSHAFEYLSVLGTVLFQMKKYEDGQPV